MTTERPVTAPAAPADAPTRREIRAVFLGLMIVLGSGAILARELHRAAAAAADIAGKTGFPRIATLPSGAQDAPVAVYREAIATVFAAGDAIIALALVAILFLPELPLRAQHEGPPRGS